MKIPFEKMSGAGNDFIVVDNRKNVLPRDIVPLVQRVCNRDTAWRGADGFIAISPSPTAPFEMKYYNADGSFGAMCGNGGRCAARFALTQKIVERSHMKFVALDSEYVADVDGSRVTLAMPPPRVLEFNRVLRVMDQHVTFHFVDVETQHAVLFLPDIAIPKMESLRDLDIETWGPAVRHHPDFQPLGANANFALIKKNGVVVLRTFERGVEGETLACGTGSVATALAAHFVHGVIPPVRVATKSGETLVVSFERIGDSVRNLSLEGSAVVEMAGDFDV